MPNAVPFTNFGSVVLDSSGNGTVRLSPNVGQRWHLSVASITVSSTINVPQCSIYIGGNPTPDAFVDGTYTGNINSTDAVANFPVTPGLSVIAVWSGGDPGATASLTIRGSMEYGQ